MLKIIFLGTGGGRFATITQEHRTGGFRVLSDRLNMHVDPGPGALVYSLEMGLNPQKINTILVSHSHLDHTNDAGILVESMTNGGRSKRGILVAARSVLYGNIKCDPSISNYHKGLPKRVIEAKLGKSFKIGNMSVRPVRAIHADPDTIGFRFRTLKNGDFGYLPDSEYFNDIGEIMSGVRLLILSVLRPSGKHWKGHMSTDEAAKVVEEVQPELAVLTHFGMLMILNDPDNEAAIIQKETGILTVAAKDGMKISYDKEIHVEEPL
jgi:phosphoribosyl 1,2-cyclic phosphodiesterase